MSDKKLDVLENIADYAIKTAKQFAVDESKVIINQSIGQSLTWRNKQCEELNREHDISISLFIYKNQKKGHVSISDNTKEGINIAIEKAINNASFTERDDKYGLTDAQYYPQITADDLNKLDLWHTPLPDVEELQQQAAIAEDAAFSYDKRIVSSGGVQTYALSNYNWLKTSNGFSFGARNTQTGINLSMIARHNNQQQNQFEYDRHCQFQSLKSPKELGEAVAIKAIESLQPVRIKSGKYPVIFSSQMATGLFNHFLKAITGTAQYRNFGFLPQCISTKIFPDWLSLIEQPLLRQGSSSSLYDYDGIAVNDNVVVRDGYVNRYLLSVYEARKLNLYPTGNASGIHNLSCVSRDKQHQFSEKEMIKQMHKGILITQLMGQGVNDLTGDYSRGASGFFIENGMIQHPIDELTIAGNLKDMFAGIIAISDTIDYRQRIHAPSVLLSEMTVAQ